MGDRLGNRLGDKIESLSKNRKLILEHIQHNSKITIPELSELIGISTTAIENNLKYLKENNVLKRIGSTKDGSWVIWYETILYDNRQIMTKTSNTIRF